SDICPPGSIDQHVDAAEPFAKLGGKSIDARFGNEVAEAMERAEAVARFLEAGAVAVAQDELCPALRQSGRAGQADAARGARDHDAQRGFPALHRLRFLLDSMQIDGPPPASRRILVDIWECTLLMQQSVALVGTAR